MTPYYQDAYATLYHGDCREVLPQLGDVDAVNTDPPYGVRFTGKRGHYRHRPGFKKHDTYTAYDDTEDNWFATVLPVIQLCIARFTTAAFFMSDTRVFDMPKGGHLGGIFLPNGCGLGRWGFQTFMHVCFYGKCPYLAARMGSRPNGKYGLWGNDSNRQQHPCAKPLAAMTWLVERTTLAGATVLDPFCGSGTTLVAAKRLGRHAIGIEIDATYCATAADRLARTTVDEDAA